MTTTDAHDGTEIAIRLVHRLSRDYLHTGAPAPALTFAMLALVNRALIAAHGRAGAAGFLRVVADEIEAGALEDASDLTPRVVDLTLFTAAASELPGSDPEAADGDRRAEGHHRDPHLTEVPAPLLQEPHMSAKLPVEAAIALAREALQSAQTSIQTAEDLRNWINSVVLQLADIARDGIAHLDRDEVEIGRFVLAFIADVPQRLGLAPAGRHA